MTCFMSPSPMSANTALSEVGQAINVASSVCAKSTHWFRGLVGVSKVPDGSVNSKTFLEASIEDVDHNVASKGTGGWSSLPGTSKSTSIVLASQSKVVSTSQVPPLFDVITALPSWTFT